jgi:hypothetical protein
MEAVFKKFDEFIDTLVGDYKFKLKKIKKLLSELLETPEIFKYIFERVYSDRRNPFTTSYHNFMSNIEAGMDTQEAIELLAQEIITRRIQEKKYGKFVVF